MEENEDRVLPWVADLYREGYPAYVEFMYGFHGGEPLAKVTEDIAKQMRESPESQEARESQEKAP